MATIFNKVPLGDVRPYVKVGFADHPEIHLHGLLDSGSAVTIIGSNFHNYFVNLGYSIQTTDNISITAAGGQFMASLGYLNLNFTFEGSTHTLRAFIVPQVDTPLILGVDFWSKFAICPKFLPSVDFISNKNNSVQMSTISQVSQVDSHLHSYEVLSQVEKELADSIMSQFKDISFDKIGLGRTHIVTHRIDTGDALPIKQRSYRLSPEKQKIIAEQVDEMLSLKVISPGESPWSSPVLVVGKKDGKPRFCLDSRKLNSITKKDAYSLPYISEILDNLRDAKYLSSIDLSKAFWQVPLHPEDREKTSFYVPGRGTFQFNVMPFGLTNAPATQQRLVDSLFGPEFEQRVFCYLDDIIIVSSTFDEHVSLLLKVLKRLKDANLSINFDKCQFFRDNLKYLGYVVDSRGLRTDPDKVDAILKFTSPSSKKEVKRFLGTASWYRRFIPQFSTIAGPLNALTSTKKNAPPFKWTIEAEQSFQKLKHCLSNTPILNCPNFDLPFQVHTDASNFGIGGMLTQVIDGLERPIAFMSRSLSGAERNYSVTEREALAVLTALEHWRCYLENGKTFTVITDHSALKWFLSLSNPTGRLARWGVRLSAFDFKIVHRKGKDNIIPDALSRSAHLALINTDPVMPPATLDEWYLKIFNGCIESPSSFPNFMIRGGKLYRYMCCNNALLSEFDWKEVVYQEERDNIIKANHSEPTCAHFGVFKTYKRLSLRYYWPGMYRDTVAFCAECDVCLAYKAPTHSTLGFMGKAKECSRPFQMISVDLVGPLPTSRKQNSYLFVVCCCFSKYCLLFPLRRATAAAVTKCLEDGVFLVHGVPQYVVLDNGCQFISRELNNMFTKYKVPNVNFTPKYTPQVNTVERYNKTIVTAISTFVNNDHRTWDVQLPKIQFALNNSVNESTKFTPSFLVHGRELVSCGSFYEDTANVNPDDVIFKPHDAYVENIGELAKFFNDVQLALFHSHAKNAQRYNLRRKEVVYNVGDIVWKRTHFLSDKDAFFSKKLAPKFQKCRIIGKKSSLVYVLEDMSGNNIGDWHIKDFKMFTR